MKLYIVSEKELKHLVSYGFKPKEIFEEFIKSKNSVEKIASGEVTQDLPQLNIWFINKKQINSLFKNYKNELINLYIERQGE